MEDEMQDNITGRDGLITLQALAYAIAAIQSLPREKQSWSNCQDMILMFNTMTPTPEERSVLADEVEGAFGHRPDFTYFESTDEVGAAVH